MIKKSFSILMIMLLLFATGAMGAAAPAKASAKTVQQKLMLDKQYKRDDKVRVLVELDDEPAIEYARRSGVKFGDLAPTVKNKLQKDAVTAQSAVKNEIKSKKVAIKYLNSFTTIVNGFSAEVKYGDMEAIGKLKNVAKVHIVNEYERPEEKPEMLYSKEFIQAQEAWREYGVKGEGMIVGVIDTGIDPDHKDMVLTDSSTAELKRADTESLISANQLPGKFYTDKVPYGYNYMDDNDTILDLGPDASMHGMHVAGTVGANGDEENGGIKGVAPEAQLLALKVFGNDPGFQSTYGDIYIRAMDDAIKLGADVLNLSLGSTAGFVSADDPEQMAVKRAVDSGVLVAISGGNSAHFGYGFENNPYASNPDIGVSGAPGVSYDSLQVASSENSFMDLEAASVSIGEKESLLPFLSAGSVHPSALDKEEFSVVDAGLGKPEETRAADLEGKFALIQRGEISFVDKALNAQAAGAVGVIIYNHTDGMIGMATDSAVVIPQIEMQMQDGEMLKTALDSGEEVKVSFNGESAKVANPESGKMSDFSSWGLTPNLDFKPEITAPGGQIYSTLNNNQYGMMSGTSMAAPHVAGGSALILERVDKEFSLAGYERAAFAKNLLMNTAKPIVDQGPAQSKLAQNNFYSPRRQGAGMMQLNAALHTPVVVTESATNEAKVALKEISADPISFTLKATNYSDAAAVYQVNVNAQTDLAEEGYLGVQPGQLEAQELQGAKVAINGEEAPVITVPANSSAEIKVDIDLSEAKVLSEDGTSTVSPEEIFANGYFAEGFVTFTDTEDQNPPLTVPYTGFKGDWNAPPILDGFVWEADSFYKMAGMVTVMDGEYGYLGYNAFTKATLPESIAISPNSDGIQEQAIPVLSFLRNAKTAEFNILDDEGKLLRKLRTENNITKNYYDSGSSPLYSLDPARSWDGKVNNKIAEGDYFYEIKAKIDYQGADFQSFKIPVKIDNTKPQLEASYSGQKLTFKAEDDAEGSGIAYIDIFIDGETLFTTEETPGLPGDAVEYILPDSLEAGQEIIVAAFDYAGNAVEKEFEAEEDSEDPGDPGDPGDPDPGNPGSPGGGGGTPPAPPAGDSQGDLKLEGSTATLTVDEGKILAAINDPLKSSVTIDLSSSQKDASSFQAVVKPETIKKIADKNKSLTVATGNASITIPAKVLKEAAGLSSGEIKFSVSELQPKKSELPAAEKGQRRISDVYDLKIIYTKDGKERYLTGFSEPVSVSLSIKGAELNDKRKAAAYYLNEQQNKWEYTGGKAEGDSVTFSVNHFSKYAVLENSKTFNDIKTHWAKDEIEVLASRSITGGKTADRFAPGDKLTRAQFAVLLVRALNIPTESYRGVFPDVTAKQSWSVLHIEAASRAGIVQGDLKGKYNPGEEITREQMAAMIVRSIRYLNEDLLDGVSSEKKFKDQSTVSPGLREAVSQAAALGIVKGKAGGTFAPKADTTRAEAAVMLYRQLSLLDEI